MMILNIILRFAWVFSISGDIIKKVFVRPEIFTMFVSFLEMFRRCLWNFIRVEKEHIANCGEFRAVDEMKYPFNDVKYEVDENELLAMEFKSFRVKKNDAKKIIRDD